MKLKVLLALLVNTSGMLLLKFKSQRIKGMFLLTERLLMEMRGLDNPVSFIKCPLKMLCWQLILTKTLTEVFEPALIIDGNAIPSKVKHLV